MKLISTVIDENTHIRRSMIATSLKEYTASGYLVFVVDGKMHERKISFSTKDNCRFIIWKQEAYKIDLPAKPISGAYNKELLYDRMPYSL